MNKTRSPAREKLTRRDLLRQGGAALGLAAASSVAPMLFSGCVAPTAAKTIKVVILHSQTGNMSMSETSIRDAELLAFE
jgi:hypothetical protein